MSPAQANKKNDGASDWSQWANHVLAELKRQNESDEELRKDLTSVTIEVVQLKVKSSLWGAAAGAITVIMFMAMSWIRGNAFPKNKPNALPMPKYYYQQQVPCTKEHVSNSQVLNKSPNNQKNAHPAHQ